MMRATELAHLMMQQTIKPGDWVIDATVGNGHDTLFLAELVGPSGRVFGFDVQDTALETTARRVVDHPQVTLIHAGHETMTECLATHGFPEGQNRLTAAMFNLGYLPGAQKTVTTRPDTTLLGLEQALACLRIRGLVTLVLYPEHPGGADEASAVRLYAQSLPGSFAATLQMRINALRPAPELLAIERLS